MALVTTTIPNVGETHPSADIATNAAAIRAALLAQRTHMLDARDFGVVGDNSTDCTATFQDAAEAAIDGGVGLLLPPGIIRIFGEILFSNGGDATASLFLAGSGNRNTTIKQMTDGTHGLVIDPAAPPLASTVHNLVLTRDAGLTGAAAGLYARKVGPTGALGWLSGTLSMIDVTVTNFRSGVSAKDMVKLLCQNCDITLTRYGWDLLDMQTALFLNCRCNAGDGDAASAVFLSEGRNFGLLVEGGEFGGANYAYFANLNNVGGIEPTKFAVRNANLEFASALTNQIINCTGTGQRHLAVTGCRFANAATATKAIISCQTSGASGVPNLEWAGNHYTPGIRVVELWGDPGGGAYATAGPVHSGEQVAASMPTSGQVQGGTLRLAGGVVSSPTFREALLPAHVATSNPPGTGWLLASLMGAAANDKVTDTWLTNPMMVLRDNYAAANRRVSLANDMLARVLGRAAYVESTTVETDLLNLTLPIGVLFNNGESVETEIFGTCAANANTKQFQVYFGGVVIADFTALAINGLAWRLIVKSFRNNGSNGYMRHLCRLEYGTAAAMLAVIPAGTGLDSTATIAFRVTATTPTAAADVICMAGKTTWWRAPSAL